MDSHFSAGRHVDELAFGVVQLEHGAELVVWDAPRAIHTVAHGLQAGGHVDHDRGGTVGFQQRQYR